MKIDTYKVFLQSILVAIIVTVATYAVAFYANWITEVNLLEAFAVFTSYSCTWMCVKQSRWNYPMGVVSTMALSVLFWQQNLLASSALNFYLIGTLIYGWFRWGNDDATRRVKSVFASDPKYLVMYAIIPVIAYLIIVATAVTLKADVPALDASILCLTVLAQFLLDNKKLETWAVWVVVNVVCIYVYFNAGLPLVALQGVVFLGNTFYGAYEWYKSMRPKGPFKVQWEPPMEVV